ncbi:hypothetical protein GXN76_00955 [Kroppenstedtia pulmonis]|uniref:Knr4/Smi1-like domain-containing protein n=1 Tax=Kroppenstedtia pulmonis TaxID=1380685 RepID=A0A7D3XQ46_9BACL|nr:SMI1/KNR4 family protein [Kroppenstedtia pulmonis]QKG83168.1 hypothetical protein GXN76_00955 [Kroppenstedtia pulmonis]
MWDQIDYGKGEVFHRSVDLKAVSFIEQRHRLSEDMLLVYYLEGKYSIDVGCYDGEGKSVIVSVGGDTRKSLFKRTVYSVEELKDVLERAVTVAHKVLDQPDEESSYTSVISTPEYLKGSVDQLLGRVEVEWEENESHVTEEMLRKVEKEWGVLLPDELKKIVLHCNGGGPVPLYFKAQDTSVFLQYLFSFHPRDCENIYNKQDHLPKGVYAIGDTSSSMLCLDYRSGSNEPEVKEIYVAPHSLKVEEYHVANSFGEFLAGLHPYIDWLEPVREESMDGLKRNLEELERFWGIILPLHYKRLVLKSNGGYPELRYFYHERGKDGIDHLLRVDQLDAENGVWTVYQNDFKGTSFYPFAKCLSGSYLCHHYKKGKPTVIWWDPQHHVQLEVKSSIGRLLDYLYIS